MKIIVCGASGRMGKQLIEIIRKSNCHKIAAAVDVIRQEGEFFCCCDINEVTEKADVIIDFSHHSATPALLSYALEKKMPIVIAPTGHTDEEKAAAAEAAKSIPVFMSGNMSIGIALLMKLVRETVKIFPDADVEIVETHHNQKLDVPSGTALMLAKAASDEKKNSTLVIGRHENGKRRPEEIGIHSIRSGRVVGEHEVRIDTGTQTLVLKHEAHSRELFAEGAVTAAEYLLTRECGMFDVQSLL